MITKQKFYFIRHGQTAWNFEHRLQGNSDIPLNQTGIEQAYAAREAFRNIPITTICASPLSRARQTAEIVNEVLNCPIIDLPDLKECHFGIHEGSYSYDWLANWLNGDASSVPQEVEPYDAFIARATRGINLALTKPGPVLIVAHGGIYMPINQLLPQDQRKHIANCEPVQLDPPGSGKDTWNLTFL